MDGEDSRCAGRCSNARMAVTSHTRGTWLVGGTEVWEDSEAMCVRTVRSSKPHKPGQCRPASLHETTHIIGLNSMPNAHIADSTHIKLHPPINTHVPGSVKTPLHFAASPRHMQGMPAIQSHGEIHTGHAAVKVRWHYNHNQPSVGDSVATTSPV